MSEKFSPEQRIEKELAAFASADSARSTSALSWQKELLESLTSVEDLARENLVTIDEAVSLSAIGERFRVRIPRYYAGLIDRTALGRATCPIRKQALPDLGEEDPALPEWAQEWSIRAFGRPSPWTDDAIGDVAKLEAPRLTHRYENRAILHVSSLCALYCRFCFRKTHLNDAERGLYEGAFDSAFEYLKSHHEIRELILTGGDPLSMTDAWWERFLARAGEIPHLKHVRVHSRMAVTLPSRLSDSLAAVFVASPVRVSLVSHFNHPRELTELSRERLGAFSRAGVALYNQSVLLAGVNDREDTLYTLFQNLYEEGVAPYYLHHADWTPGTFHFRTSIARGRELMQALRGRLSGPALPDYVLDLSGGHGKVSLLGDQVQVLETREDGEISGERTEIALSHTRQASAGARLRARVGYVNFWRDGCSTPSLPKKL